MTARHGVRGLCVLLLWLWWSCGLGAARAAEGAPPVPLTDEETAWLADKSDRIRVGITEVAPLMLRDMPSGQYRGLAIDYLRLHEQRLGIRFQLVYFQTWTDALEAARAKQIDVLLPTVRTSERERFLLFPQPYVTLENKIIVRQSDVRVAPVTLSALRGKRVAVMLNSAAHERLRRDYPEIVPVPAVNERQVLAEVAFHNADAAIIELGRAIWYIDRENLANLAIGGDAAIDYPLSMAVRNDWPVLATILDKTVRTITPAEHTAIRQQWVRLADPDRVPDWVEWSLAGAVGVALVGLLTFFFWNRTLKAEVRAQTTQLSRQLTDLQRAQQQLAENEERFRSLAEIASDWFWEQDAEWRFTRFFGGGLERVGMNFDEYLGRHRWDFPVVPGMEGPMAAHRAQVERHEPFRNFTYQVVRRDGHRLWLVTSGQPIFDSAGRFAGYRGTARDITGLMRVQEELSDSYRRVRALLDGTYSFVGLLSPEGTLLEANRASLDFVGATRSQVIGKPFWETAWWSGSAYRDRLRGAIAEARAGDLVRYETMHPDRDGAMHWVDFCINPIHDDQGKVIYLVAEGRDITDAKRSREALDALLASTGGLFGESFQRALVQQLANILRVRHVFVGELLPGRRVRTLAMCADGRIVDNMEYDLQDTPCDQVLDFACCVYPSDVAALFPKDLLLREMGIESYMGVPIFADDKQAIGILVALHDQPLVDSDGARRLMEIFSARAGMEMVRQRHEQAIESLNADLESRVNERTAQLAAANQELEAFSYSVSHDLRAPLRHIGGFVQLLRDELGDGLSADAGRYLQIITESTTRMGVLIDDLLAFSRIGRSEIHRSAVHLDKLLEEVIQDLAAETAGRDVQWKIAPLPEVQADRAMLRQVLVNLLGNALKYSRPKSPAIIEIGRLPAAGSGLHTFFVRDNGVGFNMKYVDKLFGVFQRLHSGKDFEGTGIGLANVRRIVERHGGTVWAEGIPEAGATFYFTLPCDAEAAPGAVPDVAATA